jgi:glycosyltransferase involved in cell wall biosynthesis
MKILMGIPAPGLKGGPPTHLPYLVEYFQKKDNVILQTFYYGSQNAGMHENLISKVFNTVKVIFHFIHRIIVFKPDIIHLNSAFDKKSILRDVPFSLLSKLFRKPLLFKVHGSHYELLFTRNMILRIMIKIYCWGASKIGVLSEIERQEFISQFGNSTKLIVVKNIVPGVNQNFSNENVPCKFEKKFDALFVSRIEKGKGLEDLLNAIPYILKSYPQFLLAIAGTGGNMDYCKRIADNLNLKDHIHWLGYLKDVHLTKAFNESKIFVFPSHFPEGMPMSLIEALLHGLPVITTKTRFAISYLKEGENVIFAEQNNPAELSQKIINLLKANKKHETMKINNFQFLNRFSQEKVGEEFAEIYAQMNKSSFSSTGL